MSGDDLLDRLATDKVGRRQAYLGDSVDRAVVTVEIVLVGDRLQLEEVHEAVDDAILCVDEVLELGVVMDHLVSPPLDVVEEGAGRLAVVLLVTLEAMSGPDLGVTLAGGLLQKVETVLTRAERTTQDRILIEALARAVRPPGLLRRQAEPVEALQGYGHVKLTFVPDVDGALALLLVEVLRVVVDEDARDLAKLAKELL